MTQHATFRRMQDSTAEDWAIIRPEAARFSAGLPDRILAHLGLLEGDYGGFPVDRYTHCLQTATLALKDGRDEEYVVCALLHDIGDTLGSYNHPDVAAAILEPFVSEANHWMIRHHGIIQGHNFFHHVGLDRNLRDRFRDHPHYARTVEFIERYDSPAFDAEAQTYPISVFEPMVRRLFAAPKRSLYRPAAQSAPADCDHQATTNITTR